MIDAQCIAQRSFGRDLVEAIALSVGAHAILGFLMIAARPQVAPAPMHGDLFFRVEQPPRDTALLGTARRAVLPRIAFAPADSQAIATEVDGGVPEWLGDALHGERVVPASEIAGERAASSGLSSEATPSPLPSRQWLRRSSSQALLPLAELASDRPLSVPGLHRGRPMRERGKGKLLEPKRPPIPPQGEGLTKQAQETLTWLGREAGAEHGPQLALQELAPIGLHWEGAPLKTHTTDLQLASEANLAIDLRLHRRFSGPGVLFEATFRPKSDAAFRKLRRNVVFCIDRSPSISRPRFAHFKDAVIAALGQLREEDAFNVVFFDRRLSRFSAREMLATAENVAAARAFIAREKLGGFFTAADPYASLERIIPTAVDQRVATSAILLSDGQSQLTRERQRRVICEFNERNRGKVSLFALACGENNNLPLLELVTYFNRGRLAYCRSESQLPQQLSSLLLTLRDPIGAEMLATAIDSRGQPTPQLLAPNGQQADLHAGLIHTLIGSMARPEAFYLFLQGRHSGEWIDIKRHITMEQIQPPSAELERRYLVLVAFEHYGKYLQTGDGEHLRAARELLGTLGYFAAFR